MLNFVTLYNYFLEFLTEVQIWYGKILKFGLGRLFGKIKQIPAKMPLFLATEAINKDIKNKRKFCRQAWSCFEIF